MGSGQTFPNQQLTTRRLELAFLILLSLAAFAVRAYRVSASSLSDDEALKWMAIQQYKQGHFIGVNAEHPPLMKMLAWGGYEAGHQWNRWVSQRLPKLQISEEASLRLPNLVFGTATGVLLYLFGKAMFGPVAGGSAAFFWAFMPLVVGLNRVIKEDTLLAFFTLGATYFYWRGRTAPKGKHALRFMDMSAVCFALGFASKYVIHFFALNFLVWWIAIRQGLVPGKFEHRFEPRFFAVLAITFLLVNPLVLSPAHDLTVLNYPFSLDQVQHGYSLDGHIYMNRISHTPFGVPWYFYFWVLAVKTPLPLLLAMVAGVLFVLKRKDTLPGIFLRVMILLNLFGMSLAATKCMRWILPTVPFLLLAAGGVVQEGYRWISRRPASVRRFALAGAAAVLFVWPAAETLAWSPIYSLYLNTFGGGRANAAQLFTYDELYDAGVREAMDFACHSAPANATLAFPTVAAPLYYLQRCGRQDLKIEGLYDTHYSVRPGDYVIVLEGRRYFETDELLRLVERHGRPKMVVGVEGIRCATVYRL